MTKYILKRVLLIIPIVVGVTVLVFTIMYLSPGDAADVILDSGAASDAQIAELRATLGLDKSYIEQLLRYLYQVFIRFDLGKSLINGVSVAQELSTRFPRSFLFAFFSAVLAALVGVPLGVTAAVHHNKPRDFISMIVALFGISMPGFWIALMLVIVFAYQLQWFPAYGMGGVAYWVLPTVANSLRGAAALARQTRSSMLEVIHSNYVVMAKSKGLPARSVIYKHALPNALIPIITVAGTQFGTTIGAGLIIETIFSIPGVGFYLVQGVTLRDYPVVQGGVVLLSIAFSVIILLTDQLMAVADPRIRSQFAGKRRRRKHA